MRCASNKNEVCGTDGVTYLNMCHLKAMDCYKDYGDTIRFAHAGKCKGNSCIESTLWQHCSLATGQKPWISGAVLYNKTRM